MSILVNALYVTLTISILVSSWGAGYIINYFLKNRSFYHKHSNYIFIKNNYINQIIGLNLLKWIVTKTFWRYTNPTIKILKRPDLESLVKLRKEMVNSEIGHLIGFIFILLLSLIFSMTIIYKSIVYPLLILNIFLNLYPSLLQQMNKQRVDRILNLYSNS